MGLRDRAGRVFPLDINWARDVAVEMTYNTQVIKFRKGQSQRLARRATPRVMTEFSAVLKREAVGRASADLAESQTAPFVVKTMPWRTTPLTGDVVAGATAIQVAAAPFWMQPGTKLVLESKTSIESVEVLSTSGGTIALAGATTFGYAAGDAATLAYEARAADSVKFKAATSTTWETSVVLDTVPGQEVLFSGAPEAEFEGFEVLLKKPNWSRAPEITFVTPREDVDHGWGVTEVDSPTRETLQRTQFGFMFGRETGDLEFFLGFFSRVKGKRGAFFVPTHQRDVMASGQDTPNTMDVPGEDAHYGYTDSKIFRVMAAFWPDGSVQLNRVTASTIIGGNTRLTFSDPWANLVTASTRLSWCHKARLVSDRIDLSFSTRDVGNFVLAMESDLNEGT